jgi:serine/threonine protein kinase
VLLDSSGHLRISDFGLSVELKEKNNFKIRGNAGTSGYLAPEVCTGEPYGLTCDVWTLGITCYEMIHVSRSPHTTPAPHLVGIELIANVVLCTSY